MSPYVQQGPLSALSTVSCSYTELAASSHLNKIPMYVGTHTEYVTEEMK